MTFYKFKSEIFHFFIFTLSLILMSYSTIFSGSINKIQIMSFEINEQFPFIVLVTAKFIFNKRFN